MKFEVQINLDNAVFEGENLIPEIKRILDRIGRKLEADVEAARILDANGNDVGFFEIVRHV